MAKLEAEQRTPNTEYSTLLTAWRVSAEKKIRQVCKLERKTAVAPVLDDGDSKKKLSLIYIDWHGKAEAVRLTLWIGGVPFDDQRVGSDEIKKMRASDDLPYGQVPVLKDMDDSGYVGSQSMALLRWAGTRTGLYPKDDDMMRRLCCDEVQEHLNDIIGLLRPQWYGDAMGRNPRTGELAVPLTDDQKKVVQDKLNTVFLPNCFATLERVLARSGEDYFCGSRITICDLSFYVLAAGLLDGTYCEGVSPKTAR